MYASAADLCARMQPRLIAELTGSSDAEPIEPRLNAALSDASAEIESYLRQRFVTPINPVPPVLLRIACDIATYRLFEAARDEDVKDARRRYEDAIAWLKEVAAGKIALEATAQTVAALGGASSGARLVAPIFAGHWSGL